MTAGINNSVANCTYPAGADKTKNAAKHADEKAHAGQANATVPDGNQDTAGHNMDDQVVPDLPMDIPDMDMDGFLPPVLDGDELEVER